jgi:hypothetical protein
VCEKDWLAAVSFGVGFRAHTRRCAATDSAWRHFATFGANVILIVFFFGKSEQQF